MSAHAQSSGGSLTGASGDGFHTLALSAAQTGTFTATFDATPTASPENAVVGLSSGAASAYTGISCIARFNPSGQIDAYNGTGYAAASSINYSAGVSYHFRLVVNVTARTYSVYVTPAGGSELTVGTNYAFRGSATSLNTWDLDVNATPSGSLTAINLSGTSAGGTGTPPGPFVLSPYKDVTVNMNWNTNVISSAVTGSMAGVLTVMPTNLKTLTWAFATGECGSENWAGIEPAALVSANVQSFVSMGKFYVISTGGADGVFTCGSDSGFTTFINRYQSANLLGIDFDIEGGQSQDVITNLIQRVKSAQKTFPNLRFSFTLATLGGNSPQSLSSLGEMVLNTIKSQGLTKYTINLMTMDFGSTTASNCTVVNGVCEMGQSAIAAAENLHSFYGTPYNQIELTPMIGGNDTQAEVFTIPDVSTISAYVVQKGLAGIHFWSFDRDQDCAPGPASSICNSYGQAGTLGFTTHFLSSLGL